VVASRRTAIKELEMHFRRNGYVRRQCAERLAAEGYTGYKKGDEVRLVARSKSELRTIRRLLKQVGFTPGRPFAAGNQWRQPLYGRDAVAQFLEMIGENGRA
jgi:hypothetical protein